MKAHENVELVGHQQEGGRQRESPSPSLLTEQTETRASRQAANDQQQRRIMMTDDPKGDDRRKHQHVKGDAGHPRQGKRLLARTVRIVRVELFLVVHSVCRYAIKSLSCWSSRLLPKAGIIFLPCRMTDATRSSLAGAPLGR